MQQQKADLLECRLLGELMDGIAAIAKVAARPSMELAPDLSK